MLLPCFLQLSILNTQCEGNYNYIRTMQHACMNNSRMHAALPSRVTGLASDQAGSTGLDPTQFKKKKR